LKKAVVRVEPLEVIVGLADDPALELLNTWAIPAPGADVIELIGDGEAYLEWSTRAGLLDEEDRAAIRDLFEPGDIDDVAAAARELRGRLRPAVLAWASPETSTPVPAPLVDELNSLLAVGERSARLHSGEHGLELRDHRRWTTSAQLLVPPAEAWARLLTAGEPGLIRQCEGCTIIFYDRTKAHRRRWCSMAICGNREKVRRHRAGVAATGTGSRRNRLPAL
jgi:predicted RNA-binding Zn ribbon-like protein